MPQTRRRLNLGGRAVPGVLAPAIGVAIAIFLIVGWALWQARQEVGRNASVAAGHLALSVARAVDASSAPYRSALWMAAATPFSQLAHAAALGPIVVTDEQGQVVAATDPAFRPDGSVVESELSRLEPDDGAPTLEVSMPFMPAGGGIPRFAFAYRRAGARGRFAGLILAFPPADFFQELTNTLIEDQPGTVTLLRQDRLVVARSPAHPADIGRPLGTPLRDDVIYSFGKIAGLPLVVTVAIETGPLYAPWRHEAAVIGTITMVMVATLIAVAASLRRELVRRIAAQDEANAIAIRYRLLADNSSDIIAHLDRTGAHRYVSPSVLALLGEAPGPLIGQHFRVLAMPEDRPAMDLALARLGAALAHTTVQYRCHHRDGRLLWMEAMLRIVPDETVAETGPVRGDIAGGVIVNIRDVTWRKHAEDELAAAAGKLTILAATDGLTGLANRRGFDEVLEREWRRARRSEEQLALLMIDADWFKSYNDQYGHLKGDEALRSIAECIADTLKRPGDLAARYGGEEFAVVLPGADERGATTIATEIRARLARLALTHAGTPTGRVTVTIGVASLLALPDRNPAELAAAADAALYDAKRGGRDRVAVHQSARFAPNAKFGQTIRVNEDLSNIL